MPTTPEGIIDQVAINLEISDRAKTRIDEEGIVVRDMKGSIIAHPAIKIQQTAGAIVTGLLKMYGVTNK